jgi:hypothetical protein
MDGYSDSKNMIQQARFEPSTMITHGSDPPTTSPSALHSDMHQTWLGSQIFIRTSHQAFPKTFTILFGLHQAGAIFWSKICLDGHQAS